MVTRHFHPFSGDSPKSVLKVDFSPLGVSQFSCPAKGQRHKLEGAPDDKGAWIVVDGNHQWPTAPGRCLRGQVPPDARGQRPLEVSRRVAFRRPVAMAYLNTLELMERTI